MIVALCSPEPFSSSLLSLPRLWRFRPALARQLAFARPVRIAPRVEIAPNTGALAAFAAGIDSRSDTAFSGKTQRLTST